MIRTLSIHRDAYEFRQLALLLLLVISLTVDTAMPFALTLLILTVTD